MKRNTYDMNTPIDNLMLYPTNQLVEKAKEVVPYEMRNMSLISLSREDLINLIRDSELEHLRIVKSVRLER